MLNNKSFETIKNTSNVRNLIMAESTSKWSGFSESRLKKETIHHPEEAPEVITNMFQENFGKIKWKTKWMF